MKVKNAALVVLLSLAFIFIILFAFGDLEKQIEKNYKYTTHILQVQNDSIEKTLDSVRAEMFRMEIDLSRHEVAFEILSKRNPQAAEQYAKIISEETE